MAQDKPYGTTVEVHPDGHEAAKTPEDCVAAGRKLLDQNPRSRELLFWTLKRCAAAPADAPVVQLFDLEDEIAALDIYGKAQPEPFFFPHWLAEAGVLDELELDEAGNPVDREGLEAAYAAGTPGALSYDEIDDMIVGFGYRVNDPGRELLRQYDPATKTEKLIEGDPEHRDAYLCILDFLQDKHNLAEVVKHVSTQEHTSFEGRATDSANPLNLLNKLSGTGAVVYSNGWVLTDEGREALDKLKAEAIQ